MNQNYNKIPCFVEKNQNKNKNLWYIQNIICGFLLQVPIALPTLPKTMCVRIFPLPHIFPLWVVPSHIIIIKEPTRIQNFKTNKVP
jgi:hypothetical protein